MIIEVTCAIIKEGEKFLLAQRSEEMSHPLKWEFPGGKLKPGESPEKCIKREIREELNLDITIEQLLPSVHHNYGYNHIKLIPFVCKPASGSIKSMEHKSVRWLTKEEIMDYDLLEADVEIIRSLFGAFSE